MKRNTVAVDCEKINPKIKENGWSNASFSRLVGKYPSWYGEVKRGNNLPSPEEAARMCVLLQTTPEKILVEQADIDLVNALLESEMEKEKAPTETSERELDMSLIKRLVQLTPDEMEKVDAFVQGLLASRQG